MKLKNTPSHKNKPIIIAALLLFTLKGYSCISCNKEIQHAINESIYTNIFILFSSFIVLTLIILFLIYFASKSYKNNAHDKKESMPLLSSAVILGIGTGGFIDGIVLHQILQWHSMFSNKFPPDNLVYKSMNMFWDGIFHLFTLLTTLVGCYLLWKLLGKININVSGHLLSGGMIIGWGVFNLVEGGINHQILKLHNVREISPNPDLWNYGFLIFSCLLLAIGWLLICKGQRKNN